MGKVLLFGEPMTLLTATTYGALDEVTNFDTSLAGAEVNVAVGLVRLGHEVTYLTRLGNDPFGKSIAKRLENEHIDTSKISYDEEYKTGIMMKNKVKVGDPEIAYYRKGSAFSHITPEVLDTIDFSQYDHIHITGIPCALSDSCLDTTLALAKKAKEANVYISFDPNLRPQLWSSEEKMIETTHTIARYANMILPGNNEGKILMGSDDPEKIAQFYQDLGVEDIIIKLGSHGAFAKTKTESFIQPGFKVAHVVDTVGAGDGFAVGIISSRLEGKTMQEATIRANAIGAMQVSVVGDNEGLPTPEKLNAYIKSRG